MNQQPHSHEHRGKSSRGILNAEPLLRRIGIEMGETVLDLGCGDGHFSAAAADLVGPEGTVYALDNDEEALHALAGNLTYGQRLAVKPLHTDASRPLPVPDKSTDVVLMVNVLHGFVANGQTEAVMAEVGRVIKRGGWLVVVEFDKRPGTPGPPQEIRLTQSDIADAVGPFGFMEVRTMRAGDYHFAVVLERGM